MNYAEWQLREYVPLDLISELTGVPRVGRLTAGLGALGLCGSLLFLAT